jgi:hypothetical protein
VMVVVMVIVMVIALDSTTRLESRSLAVSLIAYRHHIATCERRAQKSRLRKTHTLTSAYIHTYTYTHKDTMTHKHTHTHRF